LFIEWLTPPGDGLRAVVGGVMELRMRLNVLAAIVSFGFLAAIVLGVV
jgi:hypothetical protein